MIEPACHDGNLSAEPALDLVGDRKREQEVGPAGAGVFGHRQDRAEVVGGMAQPTDGQIRVKQVGVAHQHRVEERGLIHRYPTAADQSRGGGTAELVRVRADRGNELAVQRTDPASDAVEHVAFQQCAGSTGEVTRLGPDDEVRQLVH